jgi:hypothetical protein
MFRSTEATWGPRQSSPPPMPLHPPVAAAPGSGRRQREHTQDLLGKPHIIRHFAVQGDRRSRRQDPCAASAIAGDHATGELPAEYFRPHDHPAIQRLIKLIRVKGYQRIRSRHIMQNILGIFPRNRIFVRKLVNLENSYL